MIKIRKLRLEKNLTQLAVAEQLDIPNSTLQQYESGLHEPPFEMLIRIADFFEVTIDYLIGRTPIREPLDTNDEKLAYQLNHIKNLKAKEAVLTLLQEVKED